MPYCLRLHTFTSPSSSPSSPSPFIPPSRTLFPWSSWEPQYTCSQVVFAPARINSRAASTRCPSPRASFSLQRLGGTCTLRPCDRENDERRVQRFSTILPRFGEEWLSGKQCIPHTGRRFCPSAKFRLPAKSHWTPPIECHFATPPLSAANNRTLALPRKKCTSRMPTWVRVRVRIENRISLPATNC